MFLLIYAHGWATGHVKLQNNVPCQKAIHLLVIYFFFNVLLQENPSNYMVEMAKVESVSLSSSATSLMLHIYIKELHIFDCVIYIKE